MDSLIIQDVFEPYYADRRPFRVSVRAGRLVEVRAPRRRDATTLDAALDELAASSSPSPKEH